MSSTDSTPAPPLMPPLTPKRVATRPFATPRTIFALMLREMSTRYGDSPGGYIWAIIEPLGALLIMALAFSLLVHHPALGSSFILFYATGYMPFSLYQSVQTAVTKSLTYSRPLLKYPAVSWTDAIIARAVLNTLTSAMVSYLLLGGILYIGATYTVLNVVPILIATVMAAALGVGVGAINCLLAGLFPGWEVIWSIVTRPLFIASGVLFLYEDMPHMVQNILWYNPLMHVTAEMRRGFYPMYSPEFTSPTFVMAIAVGLTALSFVLLQRYHRNILNEGG